MDGHPPPAITPPAMTILLSFLAGLASACGLEPLSIGPAMIAGFAALLLLLVRNGALGVKTVDGVTVVDGEWVLRTPLLAAVAFLLLLLACLLPPALLLLSLPELVLLPSALA